MSTVDRPADDEQADSDDGGVTVYYDDAFEVPPGRRWTANIDILLIEARAMQDGETIENPAMPIDQHTKERAMARLNGGAAPWQHIEEFPRSDV